MQRSHKVLLIIPQISFMLSSCDSVITPLKRRNVTLSLVKHDSEVLCRVVSRCSDQHTSAASVCLATKSLEREPCVTGERGAPSLALEQLESFQYPYKGAKRTFKMRHRRIFMAVRKYEMILTK